MNDDSLALGLRAKMLGVVIRDAREARKLRLNECAEAMACSGAELLAFENGKDSPSLPELELLAYKLNVPLAHFMGDKTLATASAEAAHAPAPAADLTALRDRIIGVQLQQARHDARLPAHELAAAAGVTVEALAAWEGGTEPVPLPELERLSARLGVGLEHFWEDTGPVGEWDSAERAAARVRQLPPELRDFVSRPANEPYLRLAHQLSQLSNQKLRGIADALLEITY